METKLILYEGKYGHSKKTAAILRETLELPEDACRDAKDAPESLAGVTDLILVFGFLAYDTAKVLKEYLAARQEELRKMKIWIVGVGLAKEALPAFVKLIEKPLGRKADGNWFVMGGYRAADLTPEDRKLLEDFWGRKGQPVADKLFYDEEQTRNTAKEIARRIAGE